MTLVMTSLPWARVFNVCLHSHLFPLRVDWRKSDSSVDGEPQGNWRRNSNSRDVVASSPFLSRPAVRAPQRTCSQARDLTATREAGFAKIREGYGMIGRIAMTEVFCEKERKCGISPRPTNNKVRLTTATLIFSLNTSSLFLPSYSLKDRKSRTQVSYAKIVLGLSLTPFSRL